MDWILEHLQLVIALVIIVGYVLHGLKKAKEEEHPPGESGAPPAEADEAERTRRIQEEIRRRILERQRGTRPAESRPVVMTGEPEPARPSPRLRPAATPPPIPARVEQETAMQEMLDRQRSLAEKMEAIRTARASMAARPAIAARPATAYTIGMAGDTVLPELRRDLAGAQALRKAVLLREILGEPVGLKAGFRELPRR